MNLKRNFLLIIKAEGVQNINIKAIFVSMSIQGYLYIQVVFFYHIF